MITFVITYFLIGYFVNRPFYKWWNCNKNSNKEQIKSIKILVFGGWFLFLLMLVIVAYDVIFDITQFKKDIRRIKKYHKERKEDQLNKYYNDWRENLAGHKKYVEENNYIKNKYRNEFE